MRRLTAAVTAVLLVLACLTACATGDPNAPGGRATTTEPVADTTAASPTERAAIFAAVLRRYLSTPGENSFADRFANVYVIERTDVRAGDPMATMPWGTGPQITAAEQAALVEALRDVGPLRFVSSERDVLKTTEGCASVEDGILMLLGEPVGDAARMEVGVMGFVGCTGATWLRYVVQRSGAQWHVTGTTGSTAIA
jgi:hypothetical protein